MKRNTTQDGREAKKPKKKTEKKPPREKTFAENIVSMNLRKPDQRILWICELLSDLRLPKLTGFETLGSYRQGVNFQNIDEIYNSPKQYELDCDDLTFEKDPWFVFLLNLDSIVEEIIATIEGRSMKKKKSINKKSIDLSIDDDDTEDEEEDEDTMDITSEMESMTMTNDQIDEVIEERMSYNQIENAFKTLQSSIDKFPELVDLCNLIMRLHMTGCNDRVNDIWHRLNKRSFRTLFRLRNPMDSEFHVERISSLQIRLVKTPKQHEYELIGARVDQLNQLLQLERSGSEIRTLDRTVVKPVTRQVRNNTIFDYFQSGVVFANKLPSNGKDVLKFMTNLESQMIRFKLKVREFYREIIFDPTKSIIDYFSSSTTDHDWDLMISGLITRELDLDAKMASIKSN